MRKREVVLFFVMGSFLLSGCHTTNQDIQQNTDSTASESTSATEIDTSAMFSDRDKEVGYEEEESVAVLLADKGSSCESDSVSIDENVVTITEEGTYILSGSLSDGMVIVDAEDTDKIQLVLDDVSISNSQSAALYIRSADKVFVTTAAGTENELINLGTYIAGAFAVCLADTFFVLLFLFFQLQLTFFLFLAACSMQAVHSGNVFHTESGCQYGDFYSCFQ